MRLAIFSLLALLFTGCKSGTDRTAKADSATPLPDTSSSFIPIDSSTEFLDTFSSNLQPWLEQSIKKQGAHLNDFRYAENWVEDTLVVTKQNLDHDFLKQYRSVLVYSPDEKKVIDMGSYGTVTGKTTNGQMSVRGGEPDTEIAVIDLDSKKRRRIFFSGPGNLIDKGFWMNDSTVLLAGKSHLQNAEIPMLWMINLKNNSNEITRYEYTLH
jgi:hypothetical protein